MCPGGGAALQPMRRFAGQGTGRGPGVRPTKRCADVLAADQGTVLPNESLPYGYPASPEDQQRGGGDGDRTGQSERFFAARFEFLVFLVGRLALEE